VTDFSKIGGIGNIRDIDFYIFLQISASEWSRQMRDFSFAISASFS